MKKKLIVLPFIILSILFTACTEATETSQDQDTTPPKTSKENISIHNNIVLVLDEVGEKSINFISQLNLLQKEKATLETLQETYQELFDQSETLRTTITHEFKNQKTILTTFEKQYLPALDTLQGTFLEVLKDPTNQEKLEELRKVRNAYTEAHNVMVKTLNENRYY